MIRALIGSCRCICGNTISRTSAKTFSSNQLPAPIIGYVQNLYFLYSSELK
jgi:hypothetical protein